MKLLLLTLSMATALTLLSETTAMAFDQHHPALATVAGTHPSKGLDSTRTPNLRRRRSSTRRAAGSHLAALPRPQSTTTTESKEHHEGKDQPVDVSSITPTSAHLRQRLRRQRRSGLSSSPLPSVVFLAKTKTQNQGTKESKIEFNGRRLRPSSQPHASHPSVQQQRKRQLSKRAAQDSTPVKSARIPQSDPTSTPLLLLPDSNSTWQAGTFQTVQWSKQYAKSLPKDTTVDIVLVEAKTNKKIFSLKRFIPVRRGSAQVWVPVEVPEGVSVVLVLELYHGRSQEQVSTALPSSSTPSSSSSSSSSRSELDSSSSSTSQEGSGSESGPLRPSSSTPNIVRRSDINISSRRRRAISETLARDPNSRDRDSYNRQPGSMNNKQDQVGSEAGAALAAADEPLPPIVPKSPQPGSHHDINDNDYYLGSAEERPFEFLPDELRQEYPTTVKPLELDHAFGLRQRVYTMTPYTLEWRIPERVEELLDYSARVQKALGRYIQKHPRNPVPPASLLPNALFLSKVMVELVKDTTMEVVAVMAKDIPAEAMFQYLSIQDRVPSAFYRLRVQMVVVKVNLNPDTIKSAILKQQQPLPLQLSSGSNTDNDAKGSESGAWLSSLLDAGKVKPMEGWEFPAGGEVIDRYEAITRKFYVALGAL